MIVMKFGGSSVASARSIERVVEIVKDHHERRPVVVVSAMGKTTDRLKEIFQHAARASCYTAWRQLEDLRQFHTQETIRLLGEHARALLDQRIEPLFRELHGIVLELEEGRKATPAINDQVLSFGERISSEIVAAALEQNGVMPATHVRAQDVIVTGDQFTHAIPLRWETYAKLRRTVAIAAQSRVVVMGGFIGATVGGSTTTLGRGGSDLTASLVGAGVSADEIQIWTDVDGMLSCDPRVLRGGYLLRTLTYDEAGEMARLGAKVLCESTVEPAVRQGIPIVIRNTRHPEITGTTIGPAAVRTSGTVKSIACQNEMAVIHLTVQGAAGLAAISDGLNDLFTRNRIPVQLVQARADGVSFAVVDSPLLPALLRGIDSGINVRVEDRMTVVSLIGEGITNDNRVAASMQNALKNADVRMIAQGSSRLSVSLAIPEIEAPAAVEELHREFFRAADPAIFVTRETKRGAMTAAEHPRQSALGLTLADARS